MSRSLASGKNVAGIGIDVVSRRRIRNFFSEHRQHAIQKLLSIQEQHTYGKSLSAAQMARLFAAKEAFFKTLNRPWLGISGFAALEIELRGPEHFKAKTNGLKNEPASLKADGNFFESGDLVGAQAIRWSE